MYDHGDVDADDIEKRLSVAVEMVGAGDNLRTL